MGILGNLEDGVAGSLNNILSTLTNPFNKKRIALRGADFPEGFKIYEQVNGAFSDTPAVVLVGDQMPHHLIPFGGEQKLVKQYYPGNPEPSVQTLGPRESDIVLDGLFKAKHYKVDPTSSLYNAPEDIAITIDNIRLRGNVLKFVLGDFQRYGYLKKTEFKLMQKSRVQYSLTLDIIGFNKPSNGKILNTVVQLPVDLSADLLAQANAFSAKYQSPPQMPKTLAGVINGLVNDVASVIAVATNFVSTTLATAQDVTNSLNRGIGLIKNARAQISIFNRQMRQIKLSLANIGTTVAETHTVGFLPQNGTGFNQSFVSSRQAINTHNNGQFILSAQSSATNMQVLLARLHAQLSAISATQPIARYAVKRGDTLQAIANRFYKNADNWKLIYDHNKLTSSQLNPGQTLEIPKP
jgi:hypothetical protein